jgi:hypothetical protein
MHPTEGQLRAFFDSELSETELARMQAHLEICPPCRQHAESLQVRAGQVHAVLSALDPTTAESAASAREARSHFEVYSSTKEKIPMFKKLFTPRLRPVWAVLAVTIVLVAAISLPPVRAIANDILGLFRVQQVSAVPFDPLKLPENFNFAQQSITQLMAENLKYEIVGKAQESATSSEASGLAGIPVRLPASSLVTGTPKLSIEPGAKLSFKVDLPRIQAILSDAGFADIKLPKELDGSTVNAELPMIVTAVYGDYTPSGAAAGQDTAGHDPDIEGKWCTNCTVLVQLASPTIDTPAGVDLAAIGKAYLRLAGMSDAEADSFSQTVDWSTTLVIPVPNFASRETVSVDGVNGILIQQSPNYDTQYMLIWVKDGLVYALTGYGTRSTALEIANSLK